MTAPETASFAEFAGLARVKRSYVTALKQAGRLVLTEDGKAVRVAESIALIEATRDPSKIGVVRRHAEARAAQAAAEEAVTPIVAPPVDPLPDDAATGDQRRRTKALADKEEALARIAIRDDRKAAGELLETRHVVDGVGDAGTVLRKSLERLPDALAPQLVALRDEGAIRVLLSEQIEHALHETSRQLAQLARQVTP